MTAGYKTMKSQNLLFLWGVGVKWGGSAGAGSVFNLSFIRSRGGRGLPKLSTWQQGGGGPIFGNFMIT